MAVLDIGFVWVNYLLVFSWVGISLMTRGFTALDMHWCYREVDGFIGGWSWYQKRSALFSVLPYVVMRLRHAFDLLHDFCFWMSFAHGSLIM